MSRVSESLMNFGNWFHKVGMEYVKNHAAKVWYLTFGVCSMVPVLVDHILSCVLLFSADWVLQVFWCHASDAFESCH